jgi:NADH:ubiquinone oxidoreductase subunit E
MAAKTTHAVQDKIRERRKGLLPLLKKVHETEGYLSQESIKNISRKLRISENEIYGVATFYPQFRFKPPGKYNIQVCLGNSCHVGGAQNFMEAMKIEKNLGDGDTSPDQKFSLEGVGCLGCCAIAPVVVVNKDFHGRMNRVTFMRLVESLESSEKKS